MRKRMLLFLVVVAVVTTGAFAAPDFRLSAGLGGYLSADLDGAGVAEGDETVFSDTYVGFGGFVFFDATYAELSLGFLGGPVEYYFYRTTVSGPSFMGFDISLLGKYPFSIGQKITLFPLLGIKYRMVLSLEDEDGNKDDSPGDLSSLFFNLGVGLDFSLTDHLFLRGEVLAGLGLPSKSDKDLADLLPDLDTYPGLGLDIKLAIGYRF